MRSLRSLRLIASAVCRLKGELADSDFGSRISDFIRVSDFGFRICEHGLPAPQRSRQAGPAGGGQGHNEQAKCYRTWQGRITFWGRRKLRPAILWYSLLLVSGCSRTGSIEVTWKNCWSSGARDLALIGFCSIRCCPAMILSVPPCFIGKTRGEHSLLTPKNATVARAALLSVAHVRPFSHPLRRQASFVPRSPRLLRSGRLAH